MHKSPNLAQGHRSINNQTARAASNSLWRILRPLNLARSTTTLPASSQPDKIWKYNSFLSKYISCSIVWWFWRAVTGAWAWSSYVNWSTLRPGLRPRWNQQRLSLPAEIPRSPGMNWLSCSSAIGRAFSCISLTSKIYRPSQPLPVKCRWVDIRSLHYILPWSNVTWHQFTCWSKHKNVSPA